MNKMAIPASFIVKISPRVIQGGSSTLELNGLVLSKNPLISADAAVLEFGSAKQVMAYFGADSEEYAASLVYFYGYDNKFKAPRSFFVGLRVDEAIGGWMRTGPYTGTLAQLKAVTNGAFTMTIDGTTRAMTGVNLSSAASFSDVAALLTALDNIYATVTYSSLNKSFTVTSNLTGEGKDVSFAESPSSGTDLATLLNATEALGAVKSSGSDAMSVSANIQAILGKTQNWFSVTTLWEQNIDEALELQAWSASEYGWLSVSYTTDLSTTLQTTTTDMASRMKEGGDYACCVYGTVEYALFIMSAIASVDWNRINGTITLAFKSNSMLAPYVADESVAQVLQSKNCNYYGNFATRNAEFEFNYNGIMSDSEYIWLDSYANSVWFNNRLQVALFDGLKNTPRSPYTERGYTMIRAWMQDPIEEALRNGAIEPGVNLSEAQKSEIMNEAGLDISQELFTNGYYLQVLDPGAVVRAQRETPIISIWYTNGGAVQRLDVASTAVL
jgi:hypothetical protein